MSYEAPDEYRLRLMKELGKVFEDETNSKEEEIEPVEHTGPKTMTFWHGGNLDDGYKSTHKRKQGRWEYGPGLYLVTDYNTAKGYARGSRKLYRITVEQGTDLEDATIPSEEAKWFVNTYAKRSERRDILDRLKKWDENGEVPASVLLNLLINHEALLGRYTDDLRELLVQHGADYHLIDSHFGQGGKMMVLFNPKKIVKKERASNLELGQDDYMLPTDFKEEDGGGDGGDVASSNGPENPFMAVLPKTDCPPGMKKDKKLGGCIPK